MRQIVIGIGAILVATMILTGCESDASNNVTFRNDSGYQVTVTLNSPSTNFTSFALAANGGESEQSEMFIDNYTYTPTATVSVRRDDDEIIFENRP